MASKMVKTLAPMVAKTTATKPRHYVPTVADLYKTLPVVYNQGICFASYLYLHGKEEQAKEVCMELRKIPLLYAINGSLKKAGKLVCDENPYELGNVANFLVENLEIKDIAPLWHSKLLQLLDEEKPDEALLLCAEVAHRTGHVYGQHDLYLFAFKKRDFAYSKKIFNMVESKHSNWAAIFDMAYAMLIEGSKELRSGALQLLNTKDIRINKRKLMFLVQDGVSRKKYEALRIFLHELLKTERADYSDFMDSLEYLLNIYRREKLVDEISMLKEALQKSDIGFPTRILQFFEDENHVNVSVSNSSV